MANVGLQPQTEDAPSQGQFLTFVVPAPSGCNLHCSFCLIRQRREVTEDFLGPDDLARFVREAAERALIFALAIQGYEPLLRTSLPYTQAILATGRLLDLPTSLVTNGVFLADAVDLMRALAPTKIAISLDAASGDIHDRIRGVTGAWSAAVNGIEQATKFLPRTRLAVSSVLLPGKRHYLESMPKRLREIGVDEWIVNPLVRIGRSHVGGPVDDRTSLFNDLLVLQEAAKRGGVRLIVDDEFGHLDHVPASIRRPALRSLYVRTLPANVSIFRLVSSGQCSTGEGILKRLKLDAPRWQPGVVHAGDFLQMLNDAAPMACAADGAPAVNMSAENSYC
jgi:MoaA/NifB/PqqE/SkfB family radical SAM enzyme